jgi:hypothetical protein
MPDHPMRRFAGDDVIRRVGERFLACTLPKAEWTHEAHIATTAWLILERPDIEPERDLPALIRRYNESVGGVNDESQGYHETITQLFILAIRGALARTSADSLADRINWLLGEPEARRDWPLRFYSSERLFSPAARLGWVEPDLRPLDPPRGHEIVTSAVHPFRRRYVSPRRANKTGAKAMADLSRVKEHMEIVGADGVRVGTVDKVEGNRIKLTKADSGSHGDHHHYLSGGLVAAVEGNQVRLSANADSAILLEEEEGGEPITDRGGGKVKKFAIGAAVVGAVAGVGALLFRRRRKRRVDTNDTDQNSGA